MTTMQLLSPQSEILACLLLATKGAEPLVPGSSSCSAAHYMHSPQLGPLRHYMDLRTGEQAPHVNTPSFCCAIIVLLWPRNQNTIPVKGQMVNILCITNHLQQLLNSIIVTWKQPQTTCQQMSVAVLHKTLLWTLKVAYHIIFMCHVILFFLFFL